VAAAAPLLADFSYEQTSKITGGTAATKMQALGASQEPIRTTVEVKGDRMVYGDDTRVRIVDLAEETVTVVDYQAETWQVMTFAAMTQALEEISKKAKENLAGEMHAEVSAKATGETRQIAGAEARQVVLTTEMKGAGQKPHQTDHMSITAEMWMAPPAAGYREAADFLHRLATKLNWNPDQSVAIQTSILAATFGYARARRGMAEVFKEMSKLDGMPVLQEIRMTDNQPVFDMTSELGKFSAAPIEASHFEVPAGFKQVENDSRWLLP